jgi:subtilisin family serine protease
MAEIRDTLVIVRRLLLVIGWALVLIQLTFGEVGADESEAKGQWLRARQELRARIAKARFREAVTLENHVDESSESGAIPATDGAGRWNYVAEQVIVQFREGTSPERCEEIICEQGGRIISTAHLRTGGYLVGLRAGASVPVAARQFAAQPEVDFAEPNILHYIDSEPNDELYAMFDGQPDNLQRWYYNGVGVDRGLNAEAAWEITTGDSNIVIAVIDTGVLLTHPDLAANVWVNSREVPGDGLDDDGNGYVDDIHGWDFYNNGNNPNPDLGEGTGDHNVFHGTFVAGCAAAVSDNGLGVVGASWKSRIMPLKVFTDDGGASATAIAAALYYAADNGANIANMSFGSQYSTKTILRAVKYAWKKGVLIVASAGNANSKQRQYPARYKNVIAVGGSSNAANPLGRANFSQFGPKAVDVVAPAVDVVSTGVISMADQLNGHGQAGEPTYYFGNGTSFAAPLVSGEAGLLLARARQLGLEMTNADARKVILAATLPLGDDPSDIPNAGAKWAGRGRVDFLAALHLVGAMTR